MCSGNPIFYIGKNYNGLIDEVQVYAEALTATGIQKYYAQGLNRLLAKNAITEEEYNQRIAILN